MSVTEIEHAGSKPASVFAEQSSAPGRGTEGLTAPSSAFGSLSDEKQA